jgi:tetratricopeptide (TPR) repeat protein
MENGNLESAQDYLKRAIKLDPKRSLYYSNLGDCYYRKENWDAALDYYIKATDLGNRKAWAKRLLARMARHDGYDYQLIDRIMCEKLNVRTKDIERFAFDWDARETPE